MNTATPEWTDRPSFLQKAERVRQDARRAVAAEIVRRRHQARVALAESALYRECERANLAAKTQATLRRWYSGMGSVAALATCSLLAHAGGGAALGEHVDAEVQGVYREWAQAPMQSSALSEQARVVAMPAAADEPIAPAGSVLIRSVNLPKPARAANPSEPPSDPCDGTHAYDPLNYCL